MSDEETPPTKTQSLVDFVQQSWYIKALLLAITVISGSATIYQSVPTEWQRTALGVAALAGLILLALLLRDAFRWRRQSEYHRDNAYYHTANLYGIGYESIKVTAVIGTDGSAVIRREVCLKAFMDGVGQVDHYMLAREAPKTGKIQVRVVGQNGAPTQAEITTRDAAHDRIFSIVKFAHALNKNQVIEYPYEDMLPPQSFALTDAQLNERKMPFEFLAWDITRPTKCCILEVVFAPGMSITQADHDAWFGQTRSSHPIERGVTAHGWQDDSAKLPPRLVYTIDNPILALTYAITWKPVAYVAPGQQNSLETPATG